MTSDSNKAGGSPSRMDKIEGMIRHLIPFVNESNKKQPQPQPRSQPRSQTSPAPSSSPLKEPREQDDALPASSFRPAGLFMDFLAASGTKLRRKNAEPVSKSDYSSHHDKNAVCPADDLSDNGKHTKTNPADDLPHKSDDSDTKSTDLRDRGKSSDSQASTSLSQEQYQVYDDDDDADNDLTTDYDSSSRSDRLVSTETPDEAGKVEQADTPMPFDDDCYTEVSNQDDEADEISLSPWQSSFVNLVRDDKGACSEDTSNKTKVLKQSIVLSIANNMQSIFELKDDDQLLGKFNAWLVHDVLVRGHLYLTRDSLIFLAFLPKKNLEHTRRNPDFLSESEWTNPADVIHVGPVGLKVKRMGDSTFSTPITHRYFAVLKTKTLSIYDTATEWYFPTLLIDILTCTSVEILDTKADDPTLDSPTKGRKQKVKKDHRDFTDAVFTGIMSGVTSLPDITPGSLSSGEVWFLIVTPHKTYKLQADSMFSARRWCSSIQKLIFQLQNTNKAGECLLKIPLGQMQRYRNQVMSDDSGLASEESPAYFGVEYSADVYPKHHHHHHHLKSRPQLQTSQFLLYEKAGQFIDAFKDCAARHELEATPSDPRHVISTLYPSTACTTSLGKTLNVKSLRVDSFAALDSNKTSAFSKFGSLIKHPTQIFKSENSPQPSASNDSESGAGSPVPSAKPVSLSALKNMNMSLVSTSHDLAEFAGRQVTMDRHLQARNDDQLSSEILIHEAEKAPTNQDKLVMQNSGKELDIKESTSTFESIKKDIQGFLLKSKLTAAKPIHYFEISNNDKYYEGKLQAQELANRKFQRRFILGRKRTLLAVYSAHVTGRNLPKFGKLYVGLGVVCFKCSLPGISTVMILPIDDIESCRSEDSGKLSFANLIFDVRGHDPINFEFNGHSIRDDCMKVINSQLATSASDLSKGDFSDGYISLLSEGGIPGTIPLDSKLSEAELKALVIGDARIKMYEDGLRAATGIDTPILLGETPLTTTEVKPSTSLHFVLLTIGSRGDVQPFVALGRGLVSEGHTVTVATHEEFEDFVTKNGLKFRAVAGNPTDLMLLMVEHGTMSVAFLKEAGSKFRGWINELLRSSWEACQGADIIIESPSAMAGVHVAEAMGVAYMRAFTMPWTRTHAYPHAFLVPDNPMGGKYNYFTHVLFENVFWTGISGQVNKWRVDDLKLPKTNLKRLQQAKVPFLYNISPCVFPPATDFYDWVKVTGYWFLNEGASEDYKPPSDLQKFMEKAKRDKKPLVYIGFGSIVVKDSKSLTQSVVDGIIKADVRCILNKGWLDRNTDDKDAHKSEIELPSEVYLLESIPHDWLFPRIDVAVHHGGSGTTGASVRLGIPTIIKPFFGDQFFFAADVEARGIGLELKQLNSDSLNKALTKAVTDKDMKQRAKEFGEKVDHEDGVTRAIVSIYEQFEYSKSLISSKQSYNAKHGDASSDEEDEEEDHDHDKHES